MTEEINPLGETNLDSQAKLRGVRDAGDAWVTAADGKKYWGLFGAAGLLAHDPDRGVLLQHRALWSDHGGTWGIPGGAINEGEAAVTGALRESQEEAGVPGSSVSAQFVLVVDRGGWSYTTVIGHVLEPFEPEISDPESIALEWVPLADVEGLPLHPGFAGSWPLLRSVIESEDPESLITVLRSEGHSIRSI